MFSCDQCGEAFTENHNLTRHKESKHAGVKYSCDQCDYTANRRDNLNRHKKKHRRIDADQADQPDPDLSHLPSEKEKTGGDIGEPQKVKCPHCSLSLASRGSLYKHIKLKHSTPGFVCHQCGETFNRKDYLERHKCARPPTKIKTRINVEEEEPRAENDDESSTSESAFRRMLLTREWRIRQASDPLSLMNKYHSALKRSLISVLIKHAVKMYINMQMTMIRKDRFGIKERGTFYFQGSTRLLLRASQIPEMLQASTQKIVQSFDEFLRHGSGWILESIDYLRLYTAEYAPMRGKSYIPTPDSIKGKRAIVNIHNEDDRCFEYAIIASQHYQEVDDCTNSCRPSQYSKWIGYYNFDGCNMPMTLDDVSKFERNNGLAINVYHIKHDGKLTAPLRITQQKKKLEEYVNLLLIEGEKDCHYTWIRNLDKLLSYGDDHKRNFCPFCLQGFDKRYKKTLEEHLPLCREYGGQKTVLPAKEKNIIEFTDQHKW